MTAELLTKLDSDVVSARKLVRRVPEHGCVTELQGLCLQSFMFLTHAAIEAYLENLGIYAARKALNTYKTEGRITKTLVGLVSSKVLDDIGEKSKKRLLGEVVSGIEDFAFEALTLYSARVKLNNGIKKENLRGLLVPVGIDPEIEDIAAANELHAFGTHRGDIAHKFAAIRTEHTLSSINTSLKTIRSGLALYDAAIEGALS